MNSGTSMAKATDSWYTVIVIDPLAIRLTRMIVGTGVTPNQLTLLAFASRLVATLMVWTDLAWLALLFWGIGFLLDCMDGKLARLTGKTTAFGRILDEWSDITAHWFFFTSIAVRQFWPTSMIELFATLVWLVLCTAFPLRAGSEDSYRFYSAMANAPKNPWVRRYATWSFKHRLKLIPIGGIEETQVIVPLAYVAGIFGPTVILVAIYRLCGTIARLVLNCSKKPSSRGPKSVNVV